MSERKWVEVLRVDRSPMNSKVRVAALSCGHDLYVLPGKRAPVGAAVVCEKCSAGVPDGR